MLAGKGDLLPVSAFPVDGTWPTAHARSGRSATSRSRSRCGTRRSASSATSARWSARTRPSAPRSTPEARSPARRATFKSTDYRGREFEGQRYTIQVAPEDCTGCHLCVVVCPAKDKANPRHKAHRHAAAGAAAGARARRTTTSSSALPELDRATVAPRREGPAVPAAAVRVLGRLRGLRRDAVPQAADAALRRPDARSPTPPAARRSTAATCRRRRTPSNADGRGPAWSNSLFEDNAEFGLGMRLALDAQRGAGARRCCAALAAASATSWSARCSAADQSTRGGPRGAARAGRGAAAQRSRRSAGPEARAARARRRLPGAEERLDRRRRRLGLRHRLRRARPRAVAATATSTCWCSTPRSTPTPAASSRRRRRSARRPSSPSPARRSARRTSA